MTNDIKQAAEAIVEKWYRIPLEIMYTREDNQAYFAKGTLCYHSAVKSAITEVEAIIKELPVMVYIDSTPERNPKIERFNQILEHLKQM